MKEENKIIEYTTDEFLANGFYKTTMDQLAKGMKISKKTIYKFFPSKHLLLENVISRLQKKVQKELNEIIESDKSPIEKLKEVSSFFARFSIRFNNRFIKDLFNNEPELWQNVDDFRTTVMNKTWNTLIIEGKKEGLIIDKSNKIMIGVILSSIRGIINPQFLIENNIQITDAFDETFSIIINGILTEKGKKEFEKQEGK